MNLPPAEEWMTLRQVCTAYNVSMQSLFRAYKYGRVNSSGVVVKLKVYKTLSGMITTKKLIEEFLMRLNG